MTPRENGAAEVTTADLHVHPLTAPLNFIKGAPKMLLGLPAIYAMGVRNGRDWGVYGGFALVALVFALVAILFHWVTYRRFRYGVGAGEIVIESGLLTRTRRLIPFDRVQDVDIERGPLQRLFGLATVRIETGGGKSDEGVIDSVSLREADRLRDAVRAGRGSGAATAPFVMSSGNAPLFAMGLGRVLLAGLFNFSLVYLAGLFGILQTFDDFLPFDPYDPARWIGIAKGQIGGRFTAPALLAVLGVAATAGIVFGVLRTVATDYGFCLVTQGARLRRTRGLLTHSDVALPKRRVQLALISTGPVRRLLGWYELHLQTLGGAGTVGGRQPVAPLARADEIAAILAETGALRLPEAGTLQRVSRRHVLRTLLGTAVPALLAIALAAFFRTEALWALLAMPAFVATAFLSRRAHAYASSGDLLFVRRGLWQQKLWVLPVAKIQTVTITRSWLQRKLGLATLTIDTAGAPTLGGPAIVDLKLARAHALAEALGRRSSYSGRKSGTDR